MTEATGLDEELARLAYPPVAAGVREQAAELADLHLALQQGAVLRLIQGVWRRYVCPEIQAFEHLSCARLGVPRLM